MTGFVVQSPQKYYCYYKYVNITDIGGIAPPIQFKYSLPWKYFDILLSLTKREHFKSDFNTQL